MDTRLSRVFFIQFIYYYSLESFTSDFTAVLACAPVNFNFLGPSSLVWSVVRRSFLPKPAIMAAYISQHQAPLKPHQHFPSNTPPEQAMWNMNNVSQRPLPTQMTDNSRNPQRMPSDYRGNGAAQFPNGNKALAVSTAVHAPTTNNGPRNYLASGGGAMYETSRSPPSTKSMWSISRCIAPQNKH